MYLNNIDVSNGFVIHTRPFRLNSSQIFEIMWRLVGGIPYPLKNISQLG